MCLLAYLFLVRLWGEKKEVHFFLTLKENSGVKCFIGMPGAQMECRSAELYINFYANLQINGFW